MKFFGTVIIIVFTSYLSILRMEAKAYPTPPPGAAALGYTKCIINDKPTAAQIAPGINGKYDWFSGEWYEPSKPPLSDYSTKQGALAISLGGVLVSAPNDWSPGKLPLLSGKRGFYVEFVVQLSDNDPDHWPAVWLMPVEHNRNWRDDHYPEDPPKYERFMELDVEEGGFGPGLTGTVHSWQGIWSSNHGYQNIQNTNNVSPIALDMSRKHTFGCSYDPANLEVTWWVDGVKQMSAGAPDVPAIALNQNFYLILDAASHGKKLPYTMYVSKVRAFIR